MILPAPTPQPGHGQNCSMHPNKWFPKTFHHGSGDPHCPSLTNAPWLSSVLCYPTYPTLIPSPSWPKPTSDATLPFPSCLTKSYPATHWPQESITPCTTSSHPSPLTPHHPFATHSALPCLSEHWNLTEATHSLWEPPLHPQSLLLQTPLTPISPTKTQHHSLRAPDPNFPSYLPDLIIPPSSPHSMPHGVSSPQKPLGACDPPASPWESLPHKTPPKPFPQPLIANDHRGQGSVVCTGGTPFLPSLQHAHSPHCPPPSRCRNKKLGLRENLLQPFLALLPGGREHSGYTYSWLFAILLKPLVQLPTAFIIWYNEEPMKPSLQ